MPILYRIFPEHELSCVTCSGHVDMKLSQQAMKTVAGDPLHAPRFRVLVEVDGMDFEPAPAHGSDCREVFSRPSDPLFPEDEP